MSKLNSQKENGFKTKPVSNPAGLLKYINFVLDDIERLEGSPHVNKYIRTELSIAYHETKKAVEKIRAQNPIIKKTPADSNDPIEYLHNVHTWCVGQLFWENGEKIGETPAETGRNTTPTIGWRLWSCVKRIPRWIYIFALFFAALLTIFHLLGWLEPIRAFIYNILQLE